MYGRQSEIAIAAATRLAEVYDGGRTRLSAACIARDKGLRAPFVAKLLTSMARAGLVIATPGPGGGYALARPPASISIQDVVEVFEHRGTNGRRSSASGFTQSVRSLQASWLELARRTSLQSLMGKSTMPASAARERAARSRNGR